MQSIAHKQVEMAKRALEREKVKVKELQNLNKPSSKQEAIFQNYRRALIKTDPELMPHKILIYSGDEHKAGEKSR